MYDQLFPLQILKIVLLLKKINLNNINNGFYIALQAKNIQLQI